MSELIELHPGQDDPKLLQVITDSLRLGAVIAYPTDSGYALGCALRQKDALERIREIRELDQSHNFTLICRDLSEASRYAKISNSAFRTLKRLTPGGYTFIFEASKEVPDLLLSKRDTIGIRIPDHLIALMIADKLGEAFISTTLILPEMETPLTESEDVIDAIGTRVDLILDAGYAGYEPTSIIDLSCGVPVILRRGSGDVSEFE